MKLDNELNVVSWWTRCYGIPCTSLLLKQLLFSCLLGSQFILSAEKHKIFLRSDIPLYIPHTILPDNDEIAKGLPPFKENMFYIQILYQPLVLGNQKKKDSWALGQGQKDYQNDSQYFYQSNFYLHCGWNWPRHEFRLGHVGFETCKNKPSRDVKLLLNYTGLWISERTGNKIRVYWYHKK